MTSTHRGYHSADGGGDSDGNDDNYNQNGGHGRVRSSSWTYDEDHDIRQYSLENQLLPINEHENERCFESDYRDSEYAYESNEHGAEPCNSDPQLDDTRGDGDDDSFRRRRRRRQRSGTVLGKGWDLPSVSIMRRRRRFRNRVKTETAMHKRIVVGKDIRIYDDENDTNALTDGNDNIRSKHIINNTNTRIKKHARTTVVPNTISEMQQPNIVELLRDREVFGGGNNRRGGIRSTLRRRPTTAAAITKRGSSGQKPRGSYSSGFITRSSISTLDPGSEDDDDEMEYYSGEEKDASGSSKNKRRRHKRRKPKSPTTVTATDASATNGALGSSPHNNFYSKSNRSGDRNINCHRSTTDQLRTYAEEVCVTKFEGSYLGHLMHKKPEDNDIDREDNVENDDDEEEPQQTSKAVSTISIAFSPDGKTMASTHGDHTVKITCCLTGNLLQTLVGHPRTPWTVKYHPHAGEDDGMSNTPYTIIADSNSGSSSSSAANAPSGNGSDGANSLQQQPLHNDSKNSLPKRQQILASGCLGHQVRIWDWITGTCLQMIRLEYAIISLSFHPSGNLLAIANGMRLHFWGLPTVTVNNEESGDENGNDSDNDNDTSTAAGTRESGDHIGSRNSSRRGTSTSMEMRHMLRCVHFLPDGKKVIVGGVNPQSRTELQNQRLAAEERNRTFTPTMSFYLRLWDFDKRAAMGLPPIEATEPLPHGVNIENAGITPSHNYVDSTFRNNHGNRNNGSGSRSNPHQPPSILSNASAENMTRLATRRRRPISNGRPFVPKALLYNDGGFDVSPDGKTLCACAEYWLPEGVDNATDLLHPPQNDYDTDDDSDYYSESSSEDEIDRVRSSNDNINVEMNDGSGDAVNGNIKPQVDTSVNNEEKPAAVAIEVDDSVSKEEKPTAAAIERDGSVDKEEKHAAVAIEGDDSVNKEEKHAAVAIDRPITYASVVAGTVETRDANATKDDAAEDSKDENAEASTEAHTSPTRPPSSSSSIPSETPPRLAVRQRVQISSPPPSIGTTTGTMLSAPLAGALPTTPVQAGLTPQTPPPNVNPLNFPLSPPSPPGRRFPGGLGSTSVRNAQSSLQQDQTRQQNLWQNRSAQQSQHQPYPTPPQPQRTAPSSSTIGGSSENTEATIPAPPGITHRNDRQHRLRTQQTNGGVPRIYGNPFATSSRNSRGGIPKQKGRYVPHIVTISLDTEPYVETLQVVNGSVGGNSVEIHAGSGIRSAAGAATNVTKTSYVVPGKISGAFVATRPHARDRRPRLGQLLSACPLDRSKASAVTCVKFSPCTEFCLIGYGVREPHVERAVDIDDPDTYFHPVTAMYKVNIGGRMRHISTMLSDDDDVNIARFHPESGYGFVYGTKQGRIRILGPRPWNYYNS